MGNENIQDIRTINIFLENDYQSEQKISSFCKITMNSQTEQKLCFLKTAKISLEKILQHLYIST